MTRQPTGHMRVALAAALVLLSLITAAAPAAAAAGPVAVAGDDTPALGGADAPFQANN